MPSQNSAARPVRPAAPAEPPEEGDSGGNSQPPLPSNDQTDGLAAMLSLDHFGDQHSANRPFAAKPKPCMARVRKAVQKGW